MSDEKFKLTEELENFINKQGFTNGILFCTNNEDARILIVNPNNKCSEYLHEVMRDLINFMHMKKAQLTHFETRDRKKFNTSEDF